MEREGVVLPKIVVLMSYKCVTGKSSNLFAVKVLGFELLKNQGGQHPEIPGNLGKGSEKVFSHGVLEKCLERW